MVTFQQKLDLAFPRESDAALVRAVRQAVFLAADVMDNEPFLKCFVGRDLTGHVRRAAVLYNVHQSCVAGDLPFESVMTRMPRGGGHWVELRSGLFHAHICRTDAAAAFPEDTPTRQDERDTNQFEFNFGRGVVLTRPEADAMYAWLTFGANGRELSHLCWAMPRAGADEWLARTNILGRLGSSSVETITPPAKEVTLRFREHIEEALRKDGERPKRSS